MAIRLGFDVTENSAIRSADPENPTIIDPNGRGDLSPTLLAVLSGDQNQT